MTREWKDEESLLAWLAAEESEHSIKLIVSNVARSDSLLWREQRIMKCSREYTGGQPDQHSGSSVPEEWNRKIPSKKTGCRCCLTLKFYQHTEIILEKYKSKHDHPLRDKNLRFTRLTDGTRDLVMVMLTMGIDAKMIVSLIFPPPSLALMSPSSLASLAYTWQQLKRICKSTKRTHRDYYITMCDINHIQRIVEDNKIWLDENDAISIKVWATQLQQAGASVILKDKIDAACSSKSPRYDKPSLKVGELSRMCQLLAQGRDKSCQTTQSHWRVLQAYVLYSRTRRGDHSEE